MSTIHTIIIFISIICSLLSPPLSQLIIFISITTPNLLLLLLPKINDLPSASPTTNNYANSIHPLPLPHQTYSSTFPPLLNRTTRIEGRRL